MKFSQVAQVFSEIEPISSRLAITEKLAELFRAALPEEAKQLAYLSLGNLQPPYIGTQFNIANKTMQQIVGELLGLTAHEVKQLLKEHGDLGTVIETHSWDYKNSKTLQEVYQELEVIEAIEGVGSQEKKRKKLKQLLASVSPRGAKYIVRIVLGTLRLGFSDMTLIDALSWMLGGDKSKSKLIEHAYNLCADIGAVAFAVNESGMTGIEGISVTPGIPVRPAAAERCVNAKDIIKRLGTCVAQPKLDGFRLQVHVWKDQDSGETQVRFFSRNLVAMRGMFPELKRELEQLQVESLICEGEAIAYDQNTGTYLPFQQTVKRKRKHGVEEATKEVPLKLILFDIVYMNGDLLFKKTHEERRLALQELLKQLDSERIELIEERLIKTAAELDAYFSEVVTQGLEGLVVKRLDAPYQPGKRNFNWIKLKRMEEGVLDDTLDCVVLGYYLGKGKRSQFGVGAFLVGVYDSEHDNFPTVAKVGTGLKDAEWREFKKRCDEIKTALQPKNVICAKELYPDVWVSPKIVCIILADEITQSPLHSARKTKKELGLALRFPRFMGYREDKSATQATTVSELKRLYELQYQT